MAKNIKNLIVGLAATSLVVIGLSPAQAAITLPKDSWTTCADSSAAYCIESVVITVAGKAVPLTWSTSGGAGVTASADVVAGKTLPGRWSSSDFVTAVGGSYDGLYVDVHAANAYVPWVYAEVQPTLTTSSAVTMASQSKHPKYAANLNKDVAIGIKLHLGDIKTGVTFGVGQDVSTTITNNAGKATILIDGYPTTVPVASDSKMCTGMTGKAEAMVNQFITVVVPQNDPLGFGVDGASGNMYVGSNGTCKLSTPVWNAETKHFTYTAAAPRLNADSDSVNKGFYHAVISFADAKLYWGLANPADAAKALTVSIITTAGGSTAAISTVSARNNNIVIDVSNFDFPDAKLDIALNPEYNGSSAATAATGSSAATKATGSSTATKATGTVKAPASKTITITCVKGKTTKKVSGVKPVCPKGYTKK